MSIDWQSAVLAPCQQVFGEAWEYLLPDQTWLPISGVYDEAYHATTPGEMDIDTTNPVLGVSVADFPALPQQGERLRRVATGEQFDIRDPRPDGHGHLLLFLTFAG
jgi:hypothetical protein